MWIYWRLSSNTCIRVIFYQYRNHSVNQAPFISTWISPCLSMSQVFPPYNLHSACFDDGDTAWHNFDRIFVPVCRCVCPYTLVFVLVYLRRRPHFFTGMSHLSPFIRQIGLLPTVALILIGLNNKNLESRYGGGENWEIREVQEPETFYLYLRPQGARSRLHKSQTECLQLLSPPSLYASLCPATSFLSPPS